MSEVVALRPIEDPLALLVSHAEWPLLAHVEAEAALLGGLMIHNDLYASVAADLADDDFAEAVHGRIFSKIGEVIASGTIANPVTLRPLFESDVAMRALGGPGYLAQLTGSGAALIGARDFAKTVRDLSKLRKLRAGLLETLREINDTSAWKPLPAILEKIDAVALTAASSSEQANALTAAAAWDKVIKKAEDTEAGLVEPSMRVDGLPDWNHLLGGMREGNLIVLAGRPGMGKTAVAGTVATSCARAGLGTVFYTREMSTDELMQRMICDVSFNYGRSILYDKLQRGKIQPHERIQIDEARARIEHWPMIFDDSTNCKISSVVGSMRRYKRRMASKGQELRVVVIDYLQLLRADKDRDNKNHEVTEITRALKLAAKEMNVAIILLSQLSREVERREDKRPFLSDLRDSGSIEQDADAVIFVYRDEYYLKASEPKVGDKRRADWEIDLQASRDKVELIAAKVRRGATGKRICQFFAAHQAVRGSNFFSEGQY
jgi:replicative DNA helicase